MSVQVYDGITPELTRMAGQMRSTQGLMRVLGGELRAALQEHFRGRGWSIYRQIAAATVLSRWTPSEAVVSVGGDEGRILQHKINGGVVTPNEKENMAIPLSPQAKRAGYARHFPRPLTFIRRKGSLPPFLVEVKKNRFDLHYVLKKAVYHRPDPNALPTQAMVEARLLMRARAYYAAVMRPPG